MSWRSDCHPLYRGWSGCLGLRFDRQPLFQAQSDQSDARSDRQLRPAVESPAEHGSPAVMQAWEPHRESHPVEICLNR
jgi:hypothetical protein